VTTPLDRFHARTKRKVDELTPKIAAAYLAGLHVLLEVMRGEAALLSRGMYDEFVVRVLSDTNIRLAFARYRASLIESLRDTTRFSARAIPGMTAANVSALPAFADPTVAASIRELDRLAMKRLSDELRAMARAVFAQGGTPRDVTQRLYRSLGLGPSQVVDADTFRATALAEPNTSLTAPQIEKMVTRYSEQRIAANAVTNARTAALMAYKRGEALAWAAARDAGLIPVGKLLMKTWRQVERPTKRMTHAEMNGMRVPFDSYWPNGDFTPGDGDPWNCMCTAQMTVV
jgi:hypothetical protein